ncbi:MAG: agmatine deiminase family protein, partial [Bacteroidota bacterium]|nr:agmatine deiminase family protein [Bacteroidota bacterium]MDX5506261.1 agmatine deiminase family protein [Bacteroidota bacterium]
MSHSIYISGLLKDRFPKVYSDLLSAFKAVGVQGLELSNTRDIWCRDYMPICSANLDWVQFEFDPKYLKEKKYLSLKTDPIYVLKELDLEHRRSSIKLEGGNFVCYGTHGVMTERVFEENPTFSKSQLIAKIQEE